MSKILHIDWFYMFFCHLQTTALKNGALRHDIHYWLGKDTSQVSHHISSLKENCIAYEFGNLLKHLPSDLNV